MKTDFQIISEAYESMNNRMVADTFWLNSAFHRFNAEMFNNKLPNVGFNVPTKNNKHLGLCAGDYNDEDGKYHNIEISITNKFNISPRIYEDILLHEMIHLENMVYYVDQLLVNGVPDKKLQHTTKCFVGEMNRINREFNRNIKVKTDISDKTIFKLSDAFRNRYFNIMKNLVYVFIIVSDKEIYYFKSYDGVYNQIIAMSKIHFPNAKIETIKPSNIYCAEKRNKNDDEEEESDEEESGSFPDMALFNAFKEYIQMPITESTEGNLPPMPEWAKKVKANGGDIQFLHGHWKMVFAD